MKQIVIKVEVPNDFEILKNLKSDNLLTDQFIGNLVQDYHYTIEVRDYEIEK